MRHCLIVFFFVAPCILINASFAQEIVWAKQSETIVEYEGASTIEMEVDQDQNIYILYNLYGSVRLETDELQAQGYSDVLLVKYNGDGDILWKRQVGGLGADYGTDLAIDHSNQVLITGSFSDEVNFLGQNLIKENGSAFFAKLGSSGELIWAKQYGTENAGGHSIGVDGNNNVLLGGSTDWYALTISKYDTNGIFVWSNPLTQNGCCIQPSISDIKSDVQNNIILGGNFFGYLNYSGAQLTYSGYTSAFILKLNENGQSLWFKPIVVNGSALNEAAAIELDIDQLSNIYFTGFFDNNATFGNITLQKRHALDDRSGFLTKISPQGNFQWATGMYGHDMIPGSIKVNRNSNEISICGSSPQWFEYEDDYISPIKSMQSFILSTDLNGQFKRATILNTESYPSYQYEIAFNGQNEFYVAGNFHADFKAGCTQLNGSNNWFNAFLIKAGKIPVVEINELNSQCVNNTTRVVVTGAHDATKFVWSFPNGIESSSGSFETVDPFINITVLAHPGKIPFSVIPYFDCYARTVYSSVLERNNGPKKPETPVGPEFLCKGDASQYSTIQSADVNNYHWILSNNLSFGTDGSNEVDITTSSSGGFGTIQVKAQNGCGESEVSDPLIITLNPKPSIPVLSGPSEVCVRQQHVKFSASSQGAQSYGWIIPVGLDANTAEPDSSSIEFNFPENKQQFIVQALAKGSCESILSEPFVISLHSKPSVPVITGPTEICAGQKNVKFTASSLGTQLYGWIVPLGLGTNKVETDSATVEFNFPEDKNQISIQAISKGLCENTISEPYLINITQPPDQPHYIDGQPKVCIGDKNVMYTVYPIQQNVVFEWDYPRGFKVNEMSSNRANFSVTEESESGILSAKVSNHCFTTATTLLIITVSKKPLKPTVNKNACDRSINYGGIEEFTWYKDLTPLTDNVASTLLISDSGYYQIEIHNHCGKEFSDEMSLVPVIENEIFISNVVTNNQDGKNDFFLVDRSLKNSVVDIFDRWGVRVFESNSYNNTWSGADLSSGVYYYQLRNKCLSKPISGSIHLTR